MFKEFGEHRMHTGLDSKSVPFIKCLCGMEKFQGALQGKPRMSAGDLIQEHISEVQALSV